MNRKLILSFCALLINQNVFAKETVKENIAKRLPTDNCDSLSGLEIKNVKINSSQTVAPGAFEFPTMPSGPMKGDFMFAPFNLTGSFSKGSNSQFCRIKMTLTPSKDSNIQAEVWLPDNWNGKFLGVGSFGWGGMIMYNGLLSGLQAGYAVTNSDTGHQGGNDGDFSLGHPEKKIDYGYRAAHETTRVAKLIVSKYYGKKPIKSYWAGCSLGGLEGLIEAKRYPNDYDGYVIGAPPNPIVKFNAMQIYSSWLISTTPDLKMTREKMDLVHQAVMDKCASDIGKAQGFVDLPENCQFQPETLLCGENKTENCLSKFEVDFVTKAFKGPVDPSTGKVFFSGPAFGTENEINLRPEPMGVALGMFKNFAFGDPNWDFKKIDWSKDVQKASDLVGPLLHVKASEIRPFLKKGGKIIFYLGWNDSHHSDDLVNFVNEINVPEKISTFLIPGMNHCASGEGCDTFDRLTAIDNWVMKGEKPEKIISYKVENEKPIRSRPICAYPKKAVYVSGAIDQASSFECR